MQLLCFKQLVWLNSARHICGCCAVALAFGLADAFCEAVLALRRCGGMSNQIKISNLKSLWWTPDWQWQVLEPSSQNETWLESKCQCCKTSSTFWQHNYFRHTDRHRWWWETNSHHQSSFHISTKGCLALARQTSQWNHLLYIKHHVPKIIKSKVWLTLSSKIKDWVEANHTRLSVTSWQVKTEETTLSTFAQSASLYPKLCSRKRPKHWTPAPAQLRKMHQSDLRDNS